MMVVKGVEVPPLPLSLLPRPVMCDIYSCHGCDYKYACYSKTQARPEIEEPAGKGWHQTQKSRPPTDY